MYVCGIDSAHGSLPSYRCGNFSGLKKELRLLSPCSNVPTRATYAAYSTKRVWALWRALSKFWARQPAKNVPDKCTGTKNNVEQNIYIYIIYKPASREVGRYCFAASSCKLNQNGKLFNACVRSYSSILPETLAVPFCVDLC